jgi:hypothetical protein
MAMMDMTTSNSSNVNARQPFGSAASPARPGVTLNERPFICFNPFWDNFNVARQLYGRGKEDGRRAPFCPDSFSGAGLGGGDGRSVGTASLAGLCAGFDYSEGTDQGLVFWPAARPGGFCFHKNFREFVVGIRGQIEVTAAIAAHLNVGVVHERDDGANRNAHVAAHAYLMANGSDSSFALVGQAIVVIEDGHRDFLTQFGDRRVPVAVADVGKLKLLELEQILNKFFHGGAVSLAGGNIKNRKRTGAGFLQTFGADSQIHWMQLGSGRINVVCAPGV